MLFKKGYTFDDVLLVPKYSQVNSRKEVDLSTTLVRGVTIDIPVISANMDTVTEYYMAEAMRTAGGLGVVHRFLDIYAQARICRWLSMWGGPVAAAVGIGEDTIERSTRLVIEGANILVVDVAHGHHQRVIDMIKRLKDTFGVKVIAGNVATAEGAMDLQEAGADAIKVGVGPGSLCTTRIVTGHGVPQLTAIMDVVSVVTVPVIADGGIRNSGDAVKALAAGADSVMIGSLFAGTTESPGEVVDGYKTYRGMASRAAQLDWKGEVSVVEGEEKRVKVKGSVKDVLANFLDGLRSGLSYSGARTIEELYDRAEFMVVSQASLAESRPHGLSGE